MIIVHTQNDIEFTIFWIRSFDLFDTFLDGLPFHASHGVKETILGKSSLIQFEIREGFYGGFKHK